MEHAFIVSQEAENERLDKFLARQLSSFSRAKISQFIQRGAVSVGGVARKPGFRLHQGQSVAVKVEEEKNELKPFVFAVKIIYEDDDIIVVDKPAGLTTHPPQFGYQETLVNALLTMGKDLSGPDGLRPGVVHRLDKETSGVLVLAKNPVSYKSLVAQFKQRTVDKEYRALCHGIIYKQQLKVNLPLGRDTRNRLKMKISFEGSKQALTEIKVIERFKNSSYLAIKILTGRMHQIRVHLKFLGHPILGDKKYGIKDKYSSLFLHAYSLGFLHPTSSKPMNFVSQLPVNFETYIKEMP